MNARIFRIVGALGAVSGALGAVPGALGAVRRALGAVARGALHGLSRDPIPRTAHVAVAADRDTALMVTASALRRLGARLLRYDGDAGTLEAQAAGVRVAVQVRAQSDDVTELAVTTAARAPRALVRRLRREIERPAGDSGSPRATEQRA
jgi:hypothetical protein